MDKRKRGFRGSIPLLILEICVLLIAVGVMYVVVTMTRLSNSPRRTAGGAPGPCLTGWRRT